MSRVPPPWITGLGFVTSIGNDRETVLHSLLTNRSGIEPHRFLEDDRSQVRAAGTIKEFDLSDPNWATWTLPNRYTLSRKVLRSLPPHGVYALCAALEAVESAGLKPDGLSDPRIGLHCASAGSTLFVHRFLEEMYRTRGRRGDPLGVSKTISGTLNFNLGAYFKIQGANLGFSSACASSSHALAYASEEIRTGRQDALLVVGAEDLNAETLLPFAALRALSHREAPGASRPFDLQRDGFVGTGGATAILLESRERARKRGARPYAALRGWGQASDGSDVAASHPEGRGLARAIRNALDDAALRPGDIAYINAHATSTQVGDTSEARGIHSVFEPAGSTPPVSSTKGITGHALSLSGALEAAISALCLHHQWVPGNKNLDEIDPECACLNLPTSGYRADLHTILSNSSGFGGSNVALILERADP